MPETCVDGSGIDSVKTAVGAGEEEYRLTPKGVIYLTLLKESGIGSDLSETVAEDVCVALSRFMRGCVRPEGATNTGIFRDPETGELRWDAVSFDTERLY